MYETEFAQRLAQLRVQKGTSARDMSLSIGQNPGYINAIENGKSFPTMRSFFYICEYLGVTPQEFFDLSSPAPNRLHGLADKLKRLTPEQLASIETLVDELLKK